VKTLESKETKAQRNKTVTHNSVFAAAHRQMPDDDCEIDIRHFRFSEETADYAIKRRERSPTRRISAFVLEIANRQSTFGNSSGGIAQLVERQLCKLEVRGSNPLASKACKAWRQNLQAGTNSDR
jgi:hypothetical protein